MIDGKVVG